MAPWIRLLEQYAVEALLRTPAFHRGVEKVARNVHRFRHGLPPDEMGGTKIDEPRSKEGFLRHFSEEVQTQLGRAEAKSEQATKKGQGLEGASDGKRGAEWESKKAGDDGAGGAWRDAQKQASQPPKQGFLGEYMGALREQIRQGK